MATSAYHAPGQSPAKVIDLAARRAMRRAHLDRTPPTPPTTPGVVVVLKTEQRLILVASRSLRRAA
jgi:hypothetical protein